MVSHLEENNLLNSKQHGFRSGKSCLTQLLHHFDDIIESLSNGDDMDAIYLDYAIAFDKVDHQLLLSNLQLYGFHSKIIRWIESFLTNRSQQVIIDGHNISITALIISGVSQGTVLGPILFLIFIRRGTPYKNGRKYCDLCTTEKVEIVLRSKDPRLINSKNEFMAKCRHKRKFRLWCIFIPLYPSYFVISLDSISRFSFPAYSLEFSPSMHIAHH